MTSRMSFQTGIVICFFIACFTMTTGKALAQTDSLSPQKVIILDRTLQPEPDRTLNYIGEIKGRSYIKLSLLPVEEQSAQAGSDQPGTQFKGSYYEAVNGHTYAVMANFNPTSRNWIIKCLSKRGQIFASFSGRENLDGDIEGVWKDKRNSFPFYLFKKESRSRS